MPNPSLSTQEILNNVFDATTNKLATNAAPADAKYVTAQAESSLSGEVNLGALTSGMLKHTVTNSVSAPATATEGTDYWKPGGTDVAVADGGTGSSTAADARAALGAAPVAAKYIVQTADSELSAEQALSTLSTGLMKVTTTTGAVTSLAAALAIGQISIVNIANTNQTTTSTSYVDITGLTKTLTTTGGSLLVMVQIGTIGSDAALDRIAIQLDLDGTGTDPNGMAYMDSDVSNGYKSVTIVHLFTGVSAASHTVKAQVKRASGTGTVNINAGAAGASIIVAELVS